MHHVVWLQVDWNEINSGWGQAVLLLQTLERKAHQAKVCVCVCACACACGWIWACVRLFVRVGVCKCKYTLVGIQDLCPCR